jgi:predicted MFS family arabinose efflux permease
MLLLVYGVGGVLGNMIGGRVTDRFGSRGPLIVAMVAGIVTMSALPLAASTVPGAAVILLVWGMATWSFNPPMQNRLVELSPSTAGLVLAMNAAAIYLGVGLSGVAGGVVISLSGTVTLGPVAAALTVVALAVFVRTSQPPFAGSTTQSGPG